MPLSRLRVLNTLKLTAMTTMTTAMERMVLVYMSSLVVDPRASEAKGELRKARMSKCVIFNMKMAM